ncbi:hypothetical protein [Microbacterium aurum]|uniref:hypothetical protein n=1 Tax=Microbacterium aurum TaxID=36805 RepID=UPI00248D9E19|nr:hypothetical protein [Microbacterium aurum]MBZ6373087.1 hypothetical protein [Microbacterium hominis]
MDFVARIHGFKDPLSASALEAFAMQAGIGRQLFHGTLLPALKAANVVDYALDTDGVVVEVHEFLGVTGNLIDQSYRVLQQLHPSPEEVATLHSVEVASFAPLTASQHLEQLHRRGFADDVSELGLNLALATGLVRRIMSSELNEQVIFSPYVWESGQVEIAGFLRNLPPEERDALLGICEQAARQPGLALPSVVETTPGIFGAAQKVGLVQAATVKSTGGAGAQTYVFSPTIESDDDRFTTTEALNQRKLFVAHMLFGHERAERGGGRILDPVVLVRALLNRRSVGPASNISTDYHLLEAHGIVRVRDTGNGRAYLELVKEEIVQGGLSWLENTAASSGGQSPEVKLLQVPGEFRNPEQARAAMGDLGAADEIGRAAVLELRRELQRATRQDRPANLR